MTSGFATGVLLWLGTYALHSTLFLGGVWVIERLWKRASPALLGALWRTGLLAAIITATLHTSGLVQPVGGRLPVAFAGNTSDAPAIEADRLQPAVASTAGAVDGATSPVDDVAGSGQARFEPSFPAATANDFVAFGEMDWRRGLLAVWALIASVLAIRAILAWWAAHKELADRTPIVQGPLFERIQVLAHETGLRRLPQVSLSDRIAGPFTLPSGEICIPVWARERLPQHQLDAMLAHEMAHTLHRDSLWLTIGMAVGTLFFFQPLNALARKRLAYLAELSADDWAATRAGGGRALAECLSEFASIAQTKRTPEFVAAIAKPKSSLVERVERLLNGRYTNGVLPMKAKLLIGACAIALAALIPGLAAQANGDPAPDRTIFRNDNGEVSLSIAVTKGDYTLNATGQGVIHLAPDGGGVASISNGGYLDATYTRNGQSRRVRFTGEQGAVKRQFWANGQSLAWAAGADQFVLELMPILFRETGLDAEQRVDWLLKNRGQQALLDEIGLIDSDGVQQRYAVRYAEATAIPGQNLEHLLTTVGSQLESDSGLRATLEKIYQTQKPAGSQLARLIKAGAGIESDSEGRRLLETVSAAALGTDEAMQAYLEIAGRIDSDSEMRRALARVVTAGNLSDGRIGLAVDLARSRIESDSELSNLLAAAAARVGASDALARTYADAAESIDSDSESARALLALADKARLSPAGWSMLLKAAAKIGSDGGKASLLVAVADRLPRQEDVLAAYRAATETIGSSSEHRRAEQALR